MESSIVAALLGIVVTLLSGLFGIYLPRRNARRKAGQQLIAEFSAVNASYEKIAKDNPHLIDTTLRQGYPRLQEKVEVFRKHLFFPWEKKGFLKAWIAYYNDSGDERCQSYLHYLPFNESPPYIHNPQYITTFKRNLENILKYARQT
jgi:hypothetical protein